MRSRFVEIILLGAVIAGTAWLGSLVYHNRLGGHVEPADSSWQGSIRTEGNVTTVVNQSGSIWGRTAKLVQEASIGVEAGADEYMLGNVAGIAADDLRIYVVDSSIPVVRAYDHAGRHLANIGRRGQGPGEFDSPRSAATGGGRLYVYGDRRINVYSADGESIDTWPHGTGLDSVTPPVLADDGQLYMHDLVGDTSDVFTWQHGMIAAGPDGPHGKHVEVPNLKFERDGLLQRFPGGGMLNARVPFTPRLLWVMAPSRAIIAGVPRKYRFQIRAVDGAVTLVERFWEPVPVSPEEAEWTRASIIAKRRAEDPTWEWNGPPIPDHKPAYEGMFVGSDRRIWVSRIVATERLADCDADPAKPAGRASRSCWRQIHGYDVFDPEGILVGSVEVPDGVLLQHVVIRGDNVIGYREDDDGVGRVVRLRLVLLGAD